MVGMIVVILVGFGAKTFWQNQAKNFSDSSPIKSIPVEKITLTSSAFEDSGTIPSKYTCDGDNISPPIEIGGVPAEARTLALIMDDPDAPSGTWVHWVKFNIPPETKNIEEGKEPLGISGKGSEDNISYQGPCPPSGEHHYVFTVYALDTFLKLESGASKKEVESAMAGHLLAKGRMVGLYSRK